MLRYSSRIRRFEHFPDLPLVGPHRCQVRGPGELLRNGAAALDDPSGSQVPPGGAGDADGIDPEVLKEAPILDREDRIDHVWRDALERNRDPLLDEEAEGGPAVTVENDCRLRPRTDAGQRTRAVELSRNRGGEEGDPPRRD